MTIDDENSIYVGGLPYSATEDTVRRVFGPYGAIVAVKVSLTLFEHPFFPQIVLLAFYHSFSSYFLQIYILIMQLGVSVT